MMKQLKEYLDTNGIKYRVITHSAAYTAQEIAATAHVPGKEMTKVVEIKIDGKLAMAVLPASHFVDLRRIKEMTHATHIETAKEEDYKDIFSDCEVGSMPPFGNLVNQMVFVSTDLAEDPQIAFNAGNHRELVVLSYKDYEKLVKPQVFSFSIKEFAGKGERPKL